MRLNTLAIAILAVGLTGTVLAQDGGAPPQEQPRMGRGMGADFHGVGGQITAIDGSTLTLQTFRGETAKVKVTSSTRIRKEGAEAKLSDFKVGDRIMVAGEQDKDGVWIAQAMGQRGAGPGGQRGEGPRGAGMGGQRMAPEDNGKTYIFGVVTKINGTQLTVKKPDGAEQVIAVDDDTSFRNERRESVTLADVKVGDMVRGPGALKDGVFVSKQLNAGANRARQAASPEAPGAPPQNEPTPQDAAPDSSK